MEQLIRVARLLREEHNFRGYIHLKTIPDADPLLIEEAGRLADRLSVNIELPTDDSLKRLAPEKQAHTIRQAMGVIHQGQLAVANEPRAPRFTPAGQSTQVIVGADSTDDSTLLRNAESLYQGYGLKRVYYSAFSPIPDSPGSVPLAAPHCCASTACTRLTSCSGAMATRRVSCWASTVTWHWTSTPSWPGRWPTARYSPWT